MAKVTTDNDKLKTLIKLSDDLKNKPLYSIKSIKVPGIKLNPELYKLIEIPKAPVSDPEDNSNVEKEPVEQTDSNLIYNIEVLNNKYYLNIDVSEFKFKKNDDIINKLINYNNINTDVGIDNNCNHFFKMCLKKVQDLDITLNYKKDYLFFYISSTDQWQIVLDNKNNLKIIMKNKLNINSESIHNVSNFYDNMIDNKNKLYMNKKDATDILKHNTLALAIQTSVNFNKNNKNVVNLKTIDFLNKRQVGYYNNKYNKLMRDIMFLTPSNFTSDELLYISEYEDRHLDTEIITKQVI